MTTRVFMPLPHRLGTGLVVLAMCAFVGARQGAQPLSEATPIFVCGEDQSIPSLPPAPRWPAIVLAGDGRLFVPCPARMHPPQHREFREAETIAQGLRSNNPDLRWRAAQATARMNSSPKMVGEILSTSMVLPACNAQVTIFGGIDDGRRWQPGQLFRLMVDRTPAVRKEGAYAIAVRLADAQANEELVRGAGGELRACYIREANPEVQGQILETIGVIHYGGSDADGQRMDAEKFIVQQSNGQPAKVLGAARGLEALIRQNTRRPIDAATRERLRQLALMGNRSMVPPIADVDARIRRLAVMSLMAVGDWDPSTMTQVLNDADWQVRRLIAGRLNLSDPAQAGIGDRLDQDVAFQVRYDLLTPQSRLGAATKSCAPMIRRLSDPSPLVAMRAMDLLAATCTDLDEAVLALKDIASGLEGAGPNQWHLPTRAFTNLARLKPDVARDMLDTVSGNRAWEVRAAAAAATPQLGAGTTAARLASDGHPNVMTAALDALFRLKSPDLVDKAIKALDTNDFQLLRMAATVLKGVTRDNRERVTDALFRALRRVGDSKDTSRDARLAMIDRLGETMTPCIGAQPPDSICRSAELLPLLVDLDDEVVSAAAKLYARLMGSPAPDQNRRRRYPFQPAEAALLALPTEATITLDEGIVTLKLLSDVAPVTVARFAMLANQKFYDSRTFHRVVPNFVVQGGSPGANEYVGTSRYMRDEVGPQAAHIRGAVGISTRGGDTGDGQIFIDLVDLPRLDRDYTVFAYVTGGMELVDKLLEGGRIVSITVK